MKNSYLCPIFLFYIYKFFILLIEIGTIGRLVKMCTKQSVKKCTMLNLFKMLGILLA